MTVIALTLAERLIFALRCGHARTPLALVLSAAGGVAS
jgi:hypothetical protein